MQKSFCAVQDNTILGQQNSIQQPNWHTVDTDIPSRKPDFFDDICTLSHRLQDSQHQARSLRLEASKQQPSELASTPMPKKTKTMRINSSQTDSIKITDNTKVEDTKDFTYFGSTCIVITSGGTDEDIKARKRKAQQAFAMLRPVWRSRALTTRTKLQIFNTNVKSIFLYGSETWRKTSSSMKSFSTDFCTDLCTDNAILGQQNSIQQPNWHTVNTDILSRKP